MTFTTGYNTDIAIHKVKIVYKTYTKNGNPEDPVSYTHLTLPTTPYV